MSRQFIIYSSDARLPDDPVQRVTEIGHILSRARRHNNANEVHGYLALVGNNFIQMLEGDSVVLAGIMLRIGIDHRHTNLVLREKGDLATPLFDDWDMGCCLEPDVVRHALNKAGIVEIQDVTAMTPDQLRVFLVTLSWLAKTSGEECAA